MQTAWIWVRGRVTQIELLSALKTEENRTKEGVDDWEWTCIDLVKCTYMCSNPEKSHVMHWGRAYKTP